MYYRDKVIQAIADYQKIHSVKRYIILPFGKNGELVKQILTDYFDVSSIAIVDSKLSKYIDKVWSMERLAREYTENDCVILTAENEKLNYGMSLWLKEAIGGIQILNLLEVEQKHWFIEAMKVDRILPRNIKNDGNDDNEIELCNVLYNRRRYEIRFLVYQENILNTLEPILKICKNDENIHAVCIVDRESLTNKNYDLWCRERGFNYIYGEQYNVESDRPDALVMFNSYNKPVFSLSKYRHYIPLIVVVSSFLMPIEKTTWEHESLVLNNFADVLPDYFLYDTYMYKKSKESPLFGAKCVEMGNPKFDGIFQYNGGVPEEWKKLKGKKTVLWAPAHTYGIGFNGKPEADPRTTFDKYACVIFRFFHDHDDINLIFRPHPLFFHEMEAVGVWDEQDIKMLKCYIQSTPNVILDEMDDYNISYNNMDAILTDVQCHICCSALPMKKPIAIMYRPEENISSNAPEIAEILYNLRSEEEVVNFLNMIRNDEDPMREQRITAIPNFVKHFDGKNSNRVISFIRNKIDEIRSQINIAQEPEQ